MITHSLARSPGSVDSVPYLSSAQCPSPAPRLRQVFALQRNSGGVQRAPHHAVQGEAQRDYPACRYLCYRCMRCALPCAPPPCPPSPSCICAHSHCPLQRCYRLAWVKSTHTWLQMLPSRVSGHLSRDPYDTIEGELGGNELVHRVEDDERPTISHCTPRYIRGGHFGGGAHRQVL